MAYKALSRLFLLLVKPGSELMISIFKASELLQQKSAMLLNVTESQYFIGTGS